MSAKKQSTKGGQTAAQNKGKATGFGKKFEGDFADATPIRARAGHPKIAALKTYGGLREFLKKELGQGKSFEAVGKELQISGSFSAALSRVFTSRVSAPGFVWGSFSASRQGSSDGPILRPLCERPSGEGQEGEPAEYAFRARWPHFSVLLTTPSGRKYITNVVK